MQRKIFPLGTQATGLCSFVGSSRNYTPRGEKTKARRFAIGGPKIQQVETDSRKKNVWCPRSDPGRDAGAFAQRKKKVD